MLSHYYRPVLIHLLYSSGSVLTFNHSKDNPVFLKIHVLSFYKSKWGKICVGLNFMSLNSNEVATCYVVIQGQK